MSRLAKPRFLQRRIEHAAQRLGDADGAVEPLGLARRPWLLLAIGKSGCAGRPAGPSAVMMPKPPPAQQVDPARCGRRARLVRSPRPRSALAHLARRPRRGHPPRSLSRLAQRDHAAADDRRRGARILRSASPRSGRLSPSLAAAPLDAVLANGPASATTPAPAISTPAPRPWSNATAACSPTTSAELLTLPASAPTPPPPSPRSAFDERVAVVDGNVDRVLARYLALDGPGPRRQGPDPRHRAGRRPRPRRRFRPGPDGPRRHHLRAPRRALPGLPAAARLRRHPPRSARLSGESRKAGAPDPLRPRLRHARRRRRRLPAAPAPPRASSPR